MRITRLAVPEAAGPAYGVLPFEFGRRPLGPVVVLAGPNGGGKTRFLRWLKNSAGEQPWKNRVELEKQIEGRHEGNPTT